MDVPMANLSTETGNHHAYVLQELSGLLDAELLTDVTLHCSDGQINAHRKVLSSVSPFVRKFSAINQRSHFVVDNISCQTAQHLLNVLYTGYTKKMTTSELDNLHCLCKMLGIVLGTNSLSTNQDSIGGISMGVGKPTPSFTIAKWKRIQQEKSVFCLCREPERPGMIGCDFCDEWYHPLCLNLTKIDVQELAGEKWQCPNCECKQLRKAKTNEDKPSQKSLADVSPFARVSLVNVENGVAGWSKINDISWISDTASFESQDESEHEKLKKKAKMRGKPGPKSKRITAKESRSREVSLERAQKRLPKYNTENTKRVENASKPGNLSTNKTSFSDVENEIRILKRRSKSSSRSSSVSEESRKDKLPVTGGKAKRSNSIDTMALNNGEVKRKRGRPPKRKPVETSTETSQEAATRHDGTDDSFKSKNDSQNSENSSTKNPDDVATVKRKRGRPPKIKQEVPKENIEDIKDTTEKNDAEAPIAIKRKQGALKVASNEVENRENGLELDEDESTSKKFKKAESPPTSPSTKASSEERSETTDDLFFCYECKAIFVTREAQKSHIQTKHDKKPK